MVLPGTYRFRNVKGGIYLDESDQNKDTVYGWANSPNSDSQKWILEPAEDGWRMKNLKHSRYLTASGPQDNVDVKASVGSRDIWIFQKLAKGYVMYLKGSSHCIDLYGGMDGNGTRVCLFPHGKVQQQLWEMEPVGSEQQDLGYQQLKYKAAVPPGTYRIHSVLTTAALDLAGGKSDEGNPVVAWSAFAGPHQNWTFETGERGYRIKNGSSGTYLRSEELSLRSPLSCHSDSVEWTVTQADKGYQIHPVGREDLDLVIDLAEGNASDGAKVIVFTNAYTDNQKWRIEPA